MSSSAEAVLEKVARRVTPSNTERRKMNRLSNALREEIQAILSDSSINGAVTLQGSFARDTWLRGETDIDIFVRFAPSIERKEWIEKVLPSIKKRLSRYRIIERYAEHPFLEFHVEGTRVNIVPCYDVPKGSWKSATDRTPYHTEYMKSNLTESLRREARLLKKFAKGIGVYGAEIEVGGFSGMLVDTLALHYRSFIETIRQAGSWLPGTKLEIGKPPSMIDSKKLEPGTDLVVIDPVDPDRNLAAAVRPEKLWSFVAAGRHFLETPSPRYFFPPTFTRKTRAQFARQLGKPGREIVVISFKHHILVPDVLWGQLLKLERSLVDLLTREDFQVYRSKIWSDEKKESAVLLEVKHSRLSSIRIQHGPPVFKSEDSQGFLKRHLNAPDTVRGPWIQGERWTIEKKRKFLSIADLVKRSLRQPSRELSVPKQIGATLPRTVRVLEGQKVLGMLGKDDFDKALWQFLEANPQWLSRSRS